MLTINYMPIHGQAPHNLPTTYTEVVYREHTRPPIMVFAATVVVVFFCSLSVADSIGFVPDYIDGIPATNTSATTDSATTDTSSDVALSNLPQLGDTQGDIENTTSNSDPVIQDATLIIPNSDSIDSGVGILVVPHSAPQVTSNTHVSPQISQSAPAKSSQVVTSIVTNAHTTNPVHITIGSIDLDLPIQNPTTRDVNTLDALLVSGPARYSGSAKLGEDGNVVIFAHSSHLPIVHNQMFRAFNKIPTLSSGDSITLTGNDGKKYEYRVISVEKASTTDGTTIDLSTTHGKKLTLVTCDTLTGKSARFVLTAEFVGMM